MNELENIKARAAARHRRDSIYDMAQDVLDDLDRAIAIAEGTQKAFNLMMDERVNVATGREKEAVAAVLVLRDALKREATDKWPEDAQKPLDALADTESYEQYRVKP